VIETMVPVFAALGDETRWSILAALGEGDASASALAGRLPVTRQAIAKHLALLQDVGLVESVRVGRELQYRVIGSELSATARRLDAIGIGLNLLVQNFSGRRLVRLAGGD